MGSLLPEAVRLFGHCRAATPGRRDRAVRAGLLVYGLSAAAASPIVSATSSSAAVLFAATMSVTGVDAVDLRAGVGRGHRAAGRGVLRDCGHRQARRWVSSLIAKPVLRGFALGLALTIVVKQLPKVLAVPPAHSDFFRLAAGLVAEWRH